MTAPTLTSLEFTAALMAARRTLIAAGYPKKDATRLVTEAVASGMDPAKFAALKVRGAL